MSKIKVPVPERFHSQAYIEVLAANQSEQNCVFTKAAMLDMCNIAELGYPDEICGLLIGTSHADGWVIASVKQVPNLNEERAADRFQLDPTGYQAVDRSLRGSEHEIIGVFHSHPDCPAQPSPTDLTNAWEGFVYPIISVCNGEVAEVHCWVITDDVNSGGRFQMLPHQA